MTDYGTILKKRRKELGLRQWQVADAAHVHRSTVSLYENNKIPMNFDVLQSILEILKLKVIILKQ